MESISIILILIILTYQEVIVIQGTSCHIGVKMIPECDIFNWSPWNCHVCAIQYDTIRERGVCCPLSAGINKTLCLTLCGKLTNDVVETEHCPLHCPGYTDSTTIKSTTMATTLSKTTTFQTTLPIVTKATLILHITKPMTLPTTTTAASLPTRYIARTTLHPSLTLQMTKTMTLAATQLTTTLPANYNDTTTFSYTKTFAAFPASKSDLQGDDRVSMCIVKCASSDSQDDCVVDCIGGTFSTFCQILSFSLMFAGLLLGLTIMAVVCRIKQKSNRVKTTTSV